MVATLLMFLEPLRFAAEALMVFPTIGYRGPLAMVELVAHGVVAALSASAGFALFNKSPDGGRLSAPGRPTCMFRLAVTTRSPDRIVATIGRFGLKSSARRMV